MLGDLFIYMTEDGSGFNVFGENIGVVESIADMTIF